MSFRINTESGNLQKFNPFVLCQHLTVNERGEVIVDRNKLVKNREDLRTFYITLSFDYFWNYNNPDTTTVYFEVCGSKIFGGLYNQAYGRINKRLIAIQEKSENFLIYQYKKMDFDKMLSAILSLKDDYISRNVQHT